MKCVELFVYAFISYLQLARLYFVSGFEFAPTALIVYVLKFTNKTAMSVNLIVQMFRLFYLKRYCTNICCKRST